MTFERKTVWKICFRLRHLLMLMSLILLWHVVNEAGSLLFHEDNEMALGLLLFAQQMPTSQQNWKIKHVLKHDSGVTAMAMSPDGREVAAGGILSPVVSMWDVEKGTLIRQLQGLKGSAQAISYSPDGRFFAAGRGMVGPDDTCVYVFKAGTDNILQRLQPPKITTPFAPKGVSVVESLQYSPDSQSLAVGFNQGAIGIYDATTGKLKKTISISFHLHGSVAYSPNGKYLAFGERKKDEEELLDHYVIQILDVERGGISKTLSGHSDLITSLAFAPNGKSLASATRTGTSRGMLDRKSNQFVRKLNEDPIRIWDIETGALVKELAGHTSSVMSLAFYQGGQYLVSGGHDKTIKIWDVARGELVTTVTGHNGLIESVAVSQDGRRLVSGGTEYVKIWERQP